MRALKWVLILVGIYVGVVVVFESLIGYFQPSSQATLTITTEGGDGESFDRVVSRLEVEGAIYVAANHWPRAWYRRALANPSVRATISEAQAPYRAVPVSGAEHERVDDAHPLPFVFRVLTGFPPRYFLRLDPA